VSVPSGNNGSYCTQGGRRVVDSMRSLPGWDLTTAPVLPNRSTH